MIYGKLFVLMLYSCARLWMFISFSISKLCFLLNMAAEGPGQEPFVNEVKNVKKLMFKLCGHQAWIYKY